MDYCWSAILCSDFSHKSLEQLPFTGVVDRVSTISIEKIFIFKKEVYSQISSIANIQMTQHLKMVHRLNVPLTEWIGLIKLVRFAQHKSLFSLFR